MAVRPRPPANSVPRSARLLADAAESFAANMVARLGPNAEHIAENLTKSLMLVTALNPRIGYDRVVRWARHRRRRTAR